MQQLQSGLGCWNSPGGKEAGTLLLDGPAARRSGCADLRAGKLSTGGRLQRERGGSGGNTGGDPRKGERMRRGRPGSKLLQLLPLLHRDSQAPAAPASGKYLHMLLFLSFKVTQNCTD